MLLVDIPWRLAEASCAACRRAANLRADRGVIREAALALGKKLLLGGGVLMIAAHAHGLVACELRHVPRPAAEVLRKPIKPIELDMLFVARRAVPYTAPSRRIILQ
jgi:hypothetical protein